MNSIEELHKWNRTTNTMPFLDIARRWQIRFGTTLPYRELTIQELSALAAEMHETHALILGAIDHLARNGVSPIHGEDVSETAGISFDKTRKHLAKMIKIGLIERHGGSGPASGGYSRKSL